MKIAILVSVDKYSGTLSNLPACKSDMEIMKKVLNATGQYTEVLCISEGCTGRIVKSKISGFISELTGKEIEEAFFYFTGHGDFNGDQFYYVLSDFETSKRKQTSLENSEVDNLLRSLHPKLTIKIVDACHSGTTYIKNANAINEHIEKSTANFKNCYFMFSSNQEQLSYQDMDLSFFTRSFVESLSKSQGQRIRYKDIIDYISDEFEREARQTPIFITQATYTDVFCSVNSALKSITNSLSKTTDNQPDLETEVVGSESKPLKEIISNDAAMYCSAEEAEEMLMSLKEKAQCFQYPPEIISLLDFEYLFGSHDEFDKLLKEFVIGRWLNKNSGEYFAEPIEEEEDYEIEVRDSSSYGILRGGYRTKTRYRNKITGFKNTANLSYDLIRINTEPKFPNVHPFNCTIVILLSKRFLVFFYFFTQYREKNWSDRELIPDIKWYYSKHGLRDKEEVLEAINKVQQDFAAFIKSYLGERFEHLRDK